MSVQRFDRGRLDSAKRAPSGVGYVLPATVARTGIQIYFDGEKEIREYRPEEEVFHADSIASYEGSTVTVGHPDGGVSPENWAAQSAGHVQKVASAPTEIDGQKWVSAALVVSRGDAIEKIGTSSPEVREVSVGYTCDLDRTPGTSPAGEKYDAIQRNIRVNHVALVSQARAGNQARLRLDGNQEKNTMAEKRTVKVDGVDYEHGSESHVQVLTKKADEAVSEWTEAQTKVETLTKELATVQAKADKAEADLKESTSADKFEARLDATLEFRAKAAGVLGKDYAFAGKSEHDVRLDALKKLNVKIDEAKSKDEPYVSAYFDARVDGSEVYVKADDKKEVKSDAKTPAQIIQEKRDAAASKAFGSNV